MTPTPAVTTHVHPDVVSAIAAHHAARVPGVRALTPRLTSAAVAHLSGLVAPDRRPARQARRGGGRASDGVRTRLDESGVAHVEIDAAVAFGFSCPAVASAIQVHVHRGLAADVGLDSVVRVDIVELDLEPRP